MPCGEFGRRSWSRAVPRLITEARVVAALDHCDLALVLWAVRSSNRTRVLAALLDGPMTGREIIRRTGVREACAYRALKQLMKAWLVLVPGEIQGASGPPARVYQIAPQLTT